MLKILSSVDRHQPFEELYLKVRSREGRVVDDAQLGRLPHIGAGDASNYKEWRARAASLRRLQQYLTMTEGHRKVLDIGCGNGWAAARLAENANLHITAVDINMPELEQADRVFRKPNLQFCYGDIFGDIFPEGSFDLIILNSSAQYFSPIETLVERLFYFLRDDGEIHILDTPFYKEEELEAARARTEAYYGALGFPGMAANYHHHAISSLSSYRFKLMNGNSLLTKIRSLISGNSLNRFPWIRITK